MTLYDKRHKLIMLLQLITSYNTHYGYHNYTTDIQNQKLSTLVVEIVDGNITLQCPMVVNKDCIFHDNG